MSLKLFLGNKSDLNTKRHEDRGYTSVFCVFFYACGSIKERGKKGGYCYVCYRKINQDKPAATVPDMWKD